MGTDVSELNYMDVMIMLVSEFKFHGISVNKLTKERASNCLFTFTVLFCTCLTWILYIQDITSDSFKWTS